MKPGRRFGLSAEQKLDVWKAGDRRDVPSIFAGGAFEARRSQSCFASYSYRYLLQAYRKFC